IPISRSVRMTRSAISPRFAIRTFWNTVPIVTGLTPDGRSHEPDEPFRSPLRRNQAPTGHDDESHNANNNEADFLELTHGLSYSSLARAPQKTRHLQSRDRESLRENRR